MVSYKISGVRNSFCSNANTLLIGKVQGKGPLRQWWTCFSKILEPTQNYRHQESDVSIPVTARSNPWVCGRSLAGIAGSSPAGGMNVFVRVVYCQIGVSATGWSLVQRSPTECGVSNECDREAPSEETMARNCVEAPQVGWGWGGGKDGRYEGSLVLRTHKYYASLYKI